MTSEAVLPPVADWVSPADLHVDPYPVYARLRTESPVAHVPAFGMYLLTRNEDVHRMESTPELFAIHHTEPSGSFERALGPSMLNKDDPEHSREREAINPSLRPKAVRETWMPYFERRAEETLDELIEAGPGADLAEHFSIPFAARILADMVGVSQAPWQDVWRWSRSWIDATGDIMQSDEEVWERSARSHREIDALLDELIPYIRAKPDESMLSALVHAPAPLPDELVRANTKLAISGGINEPQHVISSGVLALTQHPDQLAEILGDTGLFPQAFDELVRWQAPIGLLLKRVVEDVVMSGVLLPAGSVTMGAIHSANRDPEQYVDPDVFDIHRERRPHMAFGAGPHLCAGSWAARAAISQVAWPLLYSRLEGLRVVDPDEVRFEGFMFRGFDAIPVRWDRVTAD